MEYTQTELRIMAMLAAIGVTLSWLLGGIDGTVTALLVFIVIDYATGMYAAWSIGVLSSSRGFDGARRKMIMLIVVVIAHQLDIAMQKNSPLCLQNPTKRMYISKRVDRGRALADYLLQYKT